MNDNKSVATIAAPEFINLSSNAINPGISKCEIKLFYLGENRNHSYINKETATKMAETLPGTPIVGVWYSEDDDFGDHGDILHVEKGEWSFSCATKPYGFVSPDAQVWFQKFEDTDGFGNVIEREYMMTTGYLWTEQYEEAMTCIQEGKGQSMELDITSGSWETNPANNCEFYIINDAIFSKLCILGDNVEPCFEGAAVTKPVNSDFAVKDEKFTTSLFSMINELKDFLHAERGLNMSKTPEPKEPVVETQPVEVNAEFEALKEQFAALERSNAALEEEVEDLRAFKHEQQESLEGQFSMSIEEHEALVGELEELRTYKAAQLKLEKMALIDKYSMIDELDKADVVANLDNYTVEEIESKLALLYVKANVDFSAGEGVQVDTVEEEESILNFKLDDTVDYVPPIIAQLRNIKQH